MEDVDLQQILNEIKTTAEKRRREDPELAAEIQRLQRLRLDSKFADPRVAELEVSLRKAKDQQSPGGVPERARFAWLKRAIVRVMAPYTRGQLEFNASTVRVLNIMRELLEAELGRRSQEQERIVDLIRTYNSFFHEEQRAAAIEKLAEIYRTSGHPEMRVIAERNRRLLASEPSGSASAGIDYFAFEERFRGSEKEIRDRLEKYRQIFEHHEPVLDLACGRGEFLELLREAGIDAAGVDLDAEMVSRCLAKGLTVTRENLFDYLEKLEHESLGGIFAAQLIEHLESAALVRLLVLSFQKLKIGGVLVLETINPASLFVFAHSLYLDPTHVRAYHPLGLEFLVRNFGFQRIETRFGSPVEEGRKIPPVHWPQAGEFNAAIARLNELVYGAQDYAVIGYK